MKKLLLSTIIALSLTISSAIAAVSCRSDQLCIYASPDNTIENPISIHTTTVLSEYGQKRFLNDTFTVSKGHSAGTQDYASDFNYDDTSEIEFSVVQVDQQPISNCTIDLKSRNWLPQLHTMTISKTSTGYQCHVNN